jgi:hypothetical protein
MSIWFFVVVVAATVYGLHRITGGAPALRRVRGRDRR